MGPISWRHERRALRLRVPPRWARVIRQFRQLPHEEQRKLLVELPRDKQRRGPGEVELCLEPTAYLHSGNRMGGGTEGRGATEC